MKLYGIAFSIFLAIDMVWLGLIAKNFYGKQLGFLMKTNVNWAAALIFYLIFVAGLLVFVISPALEKQSLMSAVLMGAFFGLVTYATYDLTNLATVKDWPLLVTIIDLIWGTVLAASVSTLSYLAATKLGL